MLGLPQLRLGWNSTNAYWENELPAGFRNVSGFYALQFRAGVNIADARNNVFGSQNFSVTLTDGTGNSATTPVGDSSRALFYPPHFQSASSGTSTSSAAPRAGKVVRVVHVSTGATGNTPVGTWHVYGKVPGLNSHGMYYSLFWLRGFAIHGYASVPPWPANHGCVRTPMWFAPGFYSRWSVGATVRVFA